MILYTLELLKLKAEEPNEMFRNGAILTNRTVNLFGSLGVDMILEQKATKSLPSNLVDMAEIKLDIFGRVWL